MHFTFRDFIWKGRVGQESRRVRVTCRGSNDGTGRLDSRKTLVRQVYGQSPVHVDDQGMDFPGRGYRWPARELKRSNNELVVESHCERDFKDGF